MEGNDKELVYNLRKRPKKQMRRWDTESETDDGKFQIS